MDYSINEETFRVEEVFPDLGLTPGGKYSYYLLEKKGISSKAAMDALHGANNDVHILISGIKDKNATTSQLLCADRKLNFENSESLKLQFLGNSDKRLYIGMHLANKFTVKLEANPAEQIAIEQFLSQNKGKLFANYFDDQRLLSENIEIGEAIAKKEYEKAFRLSVCEETRFDTELSVQIRRIVSGNFGNWEKVLALLPAELTKKRGLYEFLAKNPRDFRGAFLQIGRARIRTAFSAYQSKEFNELLAEKCSGAKIGIANSSLPFEPKNPFQKCKISVDGCELSNRELTRNCYFSFSEGKIIEKSAGSITISFVLEKGCYGTLLLKILRAFIQAF